MKQSSFPWIEEKKSFRKNFFFLEYPWKKTWITTYDSRLANSYRCESSDTYNYTLYLNSILFTMHLLYLICEDHFQPMAEMLLIIFFFFFFISTLVYPSIKILLSVYIWYKVMINLFLTLATSICLQFNHLLIILYPLL